jgi:hypothetical protein
MMAMEKPNAIITNNALILRLEMFLTALVTIPIQLNFHCCARRRPGQGSDFSRGVLWLPVLFAATCGFDFILFRFLASGRLSLGSAELLLNDFSELYHNLSLIPRSARTAGFLWQSLQIFFGKNAQVSSNVNVIRKRIKEKRRL